MTTAREGWLARTVGGVATASGRGGWLSIGLVLCVTFVLGGAAAGLRIDNDLERLLPVDDPVRRAVREAEAELGTLATLNVVVRGGSAETRRRFADALAADLEGDPRLRSASARVPVEELDPFLPYRLDDATFDELLTRVRAARDLILCRAQPYLCLDDPDPDAEDQLRALLERIGETRPAYLGPRGHIEREGIDALVHFVRPAESSADLDFSVDVSRWVEARIQAVLDDPASWPVPPEGPVAGMTVNPVGPYVIKAAEQQILRRDAARTGLLALACIAGLLALFLRSPRAVAAVLAPVVIGVLWTMGATRLLVGELGVTTSLIAAIVLGLGVDAGIHLVRRIREERRTHDVPEAIGRAYRALGPPMTAASMTTGGAFLVLTVSEIPAFSELGVVAASGVALCYLAFVLALPPLVRLLGIPPSQPADRVPGGARWLPPTLGLALLLAAAPSAYAMTSRGYERDGRAIQSDSTRARVEDDIRLIRRILGRDPHASVAFVPDLEAARGAVEAGEALAAQGGAGVLAGVTAVTTFLPAPQIDVDARWRRLHALREELPRRFFASALEDTPRRRIARVLDAPGPPGLGDLPASLRDRFVTTEGRYVVYAHPSYDVADIPTGAAFMRVTGPLLGGGRTFVGEPSLYARFYELASGQWKLGLALALLVVLLASVVHFRRPRPVAAVLTGLAGGFVLLLGAMDVLDVRFTLFNIALLPVILGLGIDHGVYLADAARSAPADRARTLRQTAIAVTAASTTTGVGFASLLIADSGALRSMGAVGALGALGTALAALLLVPALAGTKG